MFLNLTVLTRGFFLCIQFFRTDCYKNIIVIQLLEYFLILLWTHFHHLYHTEAEIFLQLSPGAIRYTNPLVVTKSIKCDSCGEGSVEIKYGAGDYEVFLFFSLGTETE